MAMKKMEKVILGKSDVKITPLGLGTNAVGGHNLYPNLDEEEGRALVRAALDNGINFLDTAYIYGEGRSEELVGEVLKEYPRDQYVIATKAAHTATGAFDNSPQFLKKSVAEALKRLGVDYIDLFYIHYPDESTPKNEAIAFLQTLKEEGIIRAIGVSNFSLDQLKEANQDGLVDVVQDHYNLVFREKEETLMSYALANNISFIPFFPLASGLLTGKYSANSTFPEGDLRANQPDFQGERLSDIVKRVNQLKPIADRHKVEITHIVLAWYLARKDITAIIPGAKTASQVIDNLKTLTVKLSDEEFKMIDELFPLGF